KRYFLAARTLQLGYTYLMTLPALNLLQPRLSELSDKLNESCSIMMLVDREVVCVARATARRLERDYMTVGTRFPAHASSPGKLLLGSRSDEEFEKLYECVSVHPEVSPFTYRNVTDLRKQAIEAYQQRWLLVDQETAIGMAFLAVPLKVKVRFRYGFSSCA